jgi:hypothetical protein
MHVRIDHHGWIALHSLGAVIRHPAHAHRPHTTAPRAPRRAPAAAGASTRRWSPSIKFVVDLQENLAPIVGIALLGRDEFEAA